MVLLPSIVSLNTFYSHFPMIVIVCFWTLCRMYRYELRNVSTIQHATCINRKYAGKNTKRPIFYIRINGTHQARLPSKPFLYCY